MNEINILKTLDCPSLSGRSELTYKIGHKGKDIFLCLSGNSGGGKFNKDWVAVADIDKLLSAQETPITSGTLKAIFKGKSSNSAGFMLAVLVAEGLVKQSEDTKTYECSDPIRFQAEVDKMIKSTTDGKQKKAKK